jgi:hypothetical protein
MTSPGGRESIEIIRPEGSPGRRSIVPSTIRGHAMQEETK